MTLGSLPVELTSVDYAGIFWNLPETNIYSAKNIRILKTGAKGDLFVPVCSFAYSVLILFGHN